MLLATAAEAAIEDDKESVMFTILKIVKELSTKLAINRNILLLRSTKFVTSETIDGLKWNSLRH